MADTVISAAAAHRRALVKGQARAAEITAKAYAQAWETISADLRRLQTRITDARAAGDIVDAGWLTHEARVRSLLLQVERQLNALAPLVASTTDSLVQSALTQAAADTAQILEAVGAPVQVNLVAVTQIVGVLDRGPVADLLVSKTPLVLDAAKRTLTEAVVKGWNPLRTAQALRRVATDLPATDARRIARTEQMRAYREASRLSYIGNPEVKSWVWSCRKSKRSCPYCWAQDGTIHSVRIPMAAHPNCMCTMLPLVPGLEYGEKGEKAFAKLPAADQREILGPGAHDAYKAGKITLQDLVHTSTHPDYGAVGRTGSLAAALSR